MKSALEIRKTGLPNLPAENDVLDGIRFLLNRFKAEAIKIDPRCKKSINEFSVYSWDSKAQLRGEDKPIKVNDHAPDALRYAIYSRFGKWGATIVS